MDILCICNRWRFLVIEKYLYSMLNESSGALGTEEIILSILVSMALGAVIYLSYFLTHYGSIYSRKFNITLLTLTVLTTMVMTVIISVDFIGFEIIEGVEV